jgi:formylglycine-generating enzyme required for sulfatase activity
VRVPPTLLGLAALLCAGCGSENGERSLGRLERLVFIPAGSPVIGAETRFPVDVGNPDPLLVDALEVTRVEWLAWLESLSPEDPAWRSLELWPDGLGSDAGQAVSIDGCPATGMTLAEAQAFAAAEGMRLPTAREWLRVATGPTGRQPFPWKPVPHASVANTLELGLGRLAPVGTFESGRTPAGLHDLHGNAAEWVASVDLEPFTSGGDGRTWAMGGSYRSRQQPTFRSDPLSDLDGDGQVDSGLAFHAVLLDRRTRSSDLGLRLVVEAGPWLREHAASWGGAPRTLRRLEEIGARWGPAAAPLLRELLEEAGPGAGAEGLAALLGGAER